MDKLSRAQRHKARALSGQNSHSLAFLQFAVKQSQQGPRPKQTHLGSRNGTAFCQAESLHTCCDFAGSERWSNYGRMYQQLCAVLQRWSAEGNQTRHASWENRWDWFFMFGSHLQALHRPVPPSGMPWLQNSLASAAFDHHLPWFCGWMRLPPQMMSTFDQKRTGPIRTVILLFGGVSILWGWSRLEWSSG